MRISPEQMKDPKDLPVSPSQRRHDATYIIYSPHHVPLLDQISKLVMTCNQRGLDKEEIVALALDRTRDGQAVIHLSFGPRKP